MMLLLNMYFPTDWRYGQLKKQSTVLRTLDKRQLINLHDR